MKEFRLDRDLSAATDKTDDGINRNYRGVQCTLAPLP